MKEKYGVKMPKYSKSDINRVINETEVRQMIEAAHCPRDKALISFLWLSGPRPTELLQLKVSDISLGSERILEDTKLKAFARHHVEIPKEGFNWKFVFVSIKTAKLGRSKLNLRLFRGGMRIHYFPIFEENLDDSDFFLKTLMDFWKTRQSKRNEPLFCISNSSVKWIVSNLYKNVLGRVGCAYNFRHSRMTFLSRYFTQTELQYFKGSASPRSVEPYIHGAPVLVG